MLVKELMIKNVATVLDTDDVRTICKSLSKHKISGIPVLNQSKKLVGFISERDIIAAVWKPNFINRIAKQLMTKKVCTISEDAPITHASKMFTDKKYRHLPVVKNGKVIGIIARKDITTQMLKHYY